MSTELAVAGGFTGLAAAGDDFRRKDLNYMKIQVASNAKEANWTWSTILGSHVESEVTGVIVCLTQVQYDLWGNVSGAAEKSSPYIRSLDNVTARVVGEDSGDLDLKLIDSARIKGTDDYECAKMGGYFSWSKSAAGKDVPPRANCVSTIGILRSGEAVPIFARLSRTSSPKAQEFAKRLLQAGVRPWQAVVSLGVEVVKGPKATYGRIVPRFVSRSPAEFDDVFRAYFDDVSVKLRGTLEKFTGRDAMDVVPF